MSDHNEHCVGLASTSSNSPRESIHVLYLQVAGITAYSTCYSVGRSLCCCSLRVKGMKSYLLVTCVAGPLTAVRIVVTPVVLTHVPSIPQYHVYLPTHEFGTDAAQRPHHGLANSEYRRLIARCDGRRSRIHQNALDLRERCGTARSSASGP